MNRADRLREIADQMEALMAQRDIVGMIDLTLDTLPYQIESALEVILEESIALQLPRNRMMYLYLGYSESMGRFKVGITTDVRRRAQEINKSLTHLALPADFTMEHYGFAPEAIVRAEERRLLHELRDYSVGGEWFRADSPAFTTIFDAADALWDQYYEFVRTFDIGPDIRACAPAQQLYPTLASQHAHLDRLTKLSMEWIKTYHAAIDVIRQRVHRERARRAALNAPDLFGGDQ